MLNMIRMDLYRMFRTKSLYIVWLVLTAAVLFTTSMSRQDYAYINEEAKKQEAGVKEEIEEIEEIEESEESEKIMVGLMVEIPTKAGEKVTVFDQVYANLQSKFIAIFILIFVVLFSSADLTSGYIKNIGGQVENRGRLIVSRAAALFVFTVLSMALYLVLQTAAQQIYYGYIEWGNLGELFRYLGIQTALLYALVLICMAVTVILNNNVFSIAISICLCMNMMSIVYQAADQWIHKMGAEKFQLLKYTVTGKIAMLPMLPTTKDCLTALGIAAAFGIGAVALTGQIFRKRDL